MLFEAVSKRDIVSVEELLKNMPLDDLNFQNFNDVSLF